MKTIKIIKTYITSILPTDAKHIYIQLLYSTLTYNFQHYIIYLYYTFLVKYSSKRL